MKHINRCLTALVALALLLPAAACGQANYDPQSVAQVLLDRRYRHVRPRFGRVVEHDHITVLRAPGGRFEFLHRQWRPRMVDVLGPDSVRTLDVPRAIRAVAAAPGNEGHERRRGECGRIRESCRHAYHQSSVPPCLSPGTSIVMARFRHLRMYAIRTIPTRRMPQRQYAHHCPCTVGEAAAPTVWSILKYECRWASR